MRFCEASAKDNFNVDEIFLKLVDDILCKVGVISGLGQNIWGDCESLLVEACK